MQKPGAKMRANVRSAGMTVIHGSLPFLLFSSLAFADLPSETPTTVPAPKNAEFALGPDSNQMLLLKTLRSAKKTLLINAYDFSHLGIAQAVIDRIEAGVTVQMLVETQPCCKRQLTADGKKVLVEIFKAMKASGNSAHRLFLMGSNVVTGLTAAATDEPANKVKRRFTFNHAKYVLVDGKAALVTSENFTATGHADPGKKGNRGWDIVVQDAGVVASLTKTFQEDASTTSDDVLEVKISDRLPGWITRPTITEQTTITVADRSRAVLEPVSAGKVANISVVLSPKSMTGIEKFMAKAKKSLDLEFMSLPVNWFAGRTPSLSPFVAELIELAQKGVEVRALLNDERVFADPSDDPNATTKNEDTVNYLNLIARCHSLPISGKVVDVDALDITYIHNKGMIADGKYVLVSSVNGTKNSVEKNRETALSLESTDAARYYGKAFDYDWDQSHDASAPRTACPELPSAAVTSGIAFRTPWSAAF